MTRLAERVRRAERETENGPHVVLELARNGAVDRPVARVVDARSELVREQLPARPRTARRRAHRRSRARRGASSRSPRPRPAERLARERARRRGSRRGARSRRGDRRPSRRRARAQRRSTARDRTGRAPPRARLPRGLATDSTTALPFAVVAEAARLHERRKAAPRRASRSGRSGTPRLPKELLLDEAILAALERARVRNRAEHGAPPRPERSRTRRSPRRCPPRDGRGGPRRRTARQGARRHLQRTRREPGRGTENARRAARPASASMRPS